MRDESDRAGRILILGLGNILLGDEGIGVWVVNRIREEGIVLPDGVDLADGGTSGYDLIPLMRGYDRVVIVDAIDLPDTPGSIYRFLPEDAPMRPAGLSLHETGILQVLRIMEIMGNCPEVECIGIVPENTGMACTEISQTLHAALPTVIDKVLDALLRKNREVLYEHEQA